MLRALRGSCCRHCCAREGSRSGEARCSGRESDKMTFQCADLLQDGVRMAEQGEGSERYMGNRVAGSQARGAARQALRRTEPLARG